MAIENRVMTDENLLTKKNESISGNGDILEHLAKLFPRERESHVKTTEIGFAVLSNDHLPLINVNVEKEEVEYDKNIPHLMQTMWRLVLPSGRQSEILNIPVFEFANLIDLTRNREIDITIFLKAQALMMSSKVTEEERKLLSKEILSYIPVRGSLLTVFSNKEEKLFEDRCMRIRNLASSIYPEKFIYELYCPNKERIIRVGGAKAGIGIAGAGIIAASLKALMNRIPKKSDRALQYEIEHQPLPNLKERYKVQLAEIAEIEQELRDKTQDPNWEMFTDRMHLLFKTLRYDLENGNNSSSLLSVVKVPEKVDEEKLKSKIKVDDSFRTYVEIDNPEQVEELYRKHVGAIFTEISNMGPLFSYLVKKTKKITLVKEGDLTLGSYSTSGDSCPQENDEISLNCVDGLPDITTVIHELLHKMLFSKDINELCSDAVGKSILEAISLDQLVEIMRLSAVFQKEVIFEYYETSVDSLLFSKEEMHQSAFEFTSWMNNVTDLKSFYEDGYAIIKNNLDLFIDYSYLNTSFAELDTEYDNEDLETSNSHLDTIVACLLYIQKFKREILSSKTSKEDIYGPQNLDEDIKLLSLLKSINTHFGHICTSVFENNELYNPKFISSDFHRKIKSESLQNAINQLVPSLSDYKNIKQYSSDVQILNKLNEHSVIEFLISSNSLIKKLVDLGLEVNLAKSLDLFVKLNTVEVAYLKPNKEGFSLKKGNSLIQKIDQNIDIENERISFDQIEEVTDSYAKFQFGEVAVFIVDGCPLAPIHMGNNSPYKVYRLKSSASKVGELNKKLYLVVDQSYSPELANILMPYVEGKLYFESNIGYDDDSKSIFLGGYYVKLNDLQYDEIKKAFSQQPKIQLGLEMHEGSLMLASRKVTIDPLMQPVYYDVLNITHR